jgi:hypothetical protein
MTFVTFDDGWKNTAKTDGIRVTGKLARARWAQVEEHAKEAGI